MAKKTNYTKNGMDYYRITATVGFKPDGTRIRKEFLGKSKKEATEKRDEYMDGINKGLTAGYEKVSFGDFFEDWLDHVHKPTLSQSTYNRYESLHRIWIKPSSFYGAQLVHLKSMEIQRHLNAIESAYTAKRAYLLMATFFKYCIKERLIIFNPLDNVSLRTHEPVRSEDEKSLSRTGVTTLMNAYKENPTASFIYVFNLSTGIREGEFCALTHNDIDFDNLTININKSLNRVSHPDKDGIKRTIVQINPPKTKASVRLQPLPKFLVEPLKAHILEEKKKHMRLGIIFSPNNYLFTSNNCTPIRGDHMNARWKRYQKRLGISPVINFHGLRHTFCSILAREGTPLKTAAKLMGHTKIETAAKVYIHVDQESKKEAIDLFEKAVL
jgi:integrase